MVYIDVGGIDLKDSNGDFPGEVIGDFFATSVVLDDELPPPPKATLKFSHIFTWYWLFTTTTAWRTSLRADIVSYFGGFIWALGVLRFT